MRSRKATNMGPLGRAYGAVAEYNNRRTKDLWIKKS